LRIIQSSKLLPLVTAINRVPLFDFSHKVVFEVLRKFPQFEFVAILSSNKDLKLLASYI